MTTRMKFTVLVPAFLAVSLLFTSPALRASQGSKDSGEITGLLADARTESGMLKVDTAELDAFTRSTLSWKTFASKLDRIKDHVNKVGELTGKLNSARDSGSAWQKDAIDRINPLLRDLASSVTAAINHLSEHQSLVHSTHYREYVQTTHEQASNLAGLISDYVEYGKAKDKMEALAKDLDTPDR
jgi:hypothetical protein